MFAYCNNDPVCCIDPTGALTDGQIHDAVLDRIIQDYKNSGYDSLSMSGTRIYYNGENIWNGWGYCDLYDTQTGEVWELKKQSDSYACTTTYAKRQLGKYVNGCLATNPDLPLTRGGDLLFGKQTFTISCAHGTYTVYYWQECQGILRYSYTFQQNNNKNTQAMQKARLTSIAVAAPLAVGAIGLGSLILTGGTGAPAVITFVATLSLAA